MNIRIHFTTRSSRLTGLIPILFLGLLLAGCGRKTMPKPITEGPPPQVKDLHVQVRPRGVELLWSIPEELKEDFTETSYHFSILKSELNWESRNCVDCPAPTQQELLRIDPASPAPAILQNFVFSWIDYAVVMNNAYRYQIALKDQKDRLISLSNPVPARVVPPPPSPREVHAAADMQGVLLQWKAPGKDDQGQPLQGMLQFIIERQASNGQWERLSTVPVKGHTFLDPEVVANQVYDYRVTSLLPMEGTVILSEPTLLRQIKAPEAIPPPPPRSVWVIPGKGTMEVNWTRSEGGVGGYHVYRREDKEITRLTVNPIQHPPYIDRSVKRNAVYYYAVSAVGVSSQPSTREGLLSKWTKIRSLSSE